MYLEDIYLYQDLVDLWHCRNPTERRFTWRQKLPIVQRRLEFWLVGDILQEDVESVDIIPSTSGYSCYMIVLWLEIHDVFLRVFLLFNLVTSAVTTYNVGVFNKS